jgi:hypothetical protein
VSKSKQKGTAFESLVVPPIAETYPGTERRQLAGALDKGDLLVPCAPFATECKNVAKMSLATWRAESEVEAVNAGLPYSIVVHKRKGKGAPEEQWVTTTLGDFLGIIREVRAGRG